jgi:WD40 repeat protein
MLTRGPNVISSIAVRADGSTAITAASFDKDLKVWDLRAGALVRTLPEACRAVALTKDERWLLSASQELALWDLEKIRRDAGPLARPASVFRTAVSSHCYAAGLSAGALVVWDRASGRELHRASYPAARPADGFRAIAFSSDGNTIVIATTEGLVAVRDLREWQRETTYEKGFVRALLPRANRVVTFGKPSLKDLAVWDLESGEPCCAIAGYVSHRPSAFTPDGRLAALVGEKEQIRIFSLDDGRLLHETAPRPLTSMVAAPGSRHIIIGDAEGKQLVVVELASGRVVVTVEHAVDNISDAFAMTYDGTTLMAADREGAITAWDVTTGTQRYALRPHESFVDRILITPDDRRAVSFGSHDGVVQVWDAATGKPVARFVAEGSVGEGCVSLDGRTLVACGVAEPLVLHLEEKAGG